MKKKLDNYARIHPCAKATGLSSSENCKNKRNNMSINNNIWFSSDLHLGHKNIIHLCNRPFDNITHMEETLISNHNAMVKPEDDYYDLGDVAYRCNAEYAVQRLRRLNGKIHIILGNHDKPLRQAINRGMVDDLIESGKLHIIGSTDNNIISAYQMTYKGVKLILSHYAYRTWPQAFRGAIHLYGHSHNNLPPYYRSFDVGVDANYFMPLNIGTIFEKISKLTEDFQEK